MKNSLLKSILLLAIPMLYLIPAQAQEAGPEWALLQETDGVKIYYAASACETDEFLSLKIENTNLSSSSVHLMLEVIEGEQRMHYPMLMVHLETGEAEVLDCNNLGIAGDFIPFPVQQISGVELSIKHFLVAKN